MLYKIISNKIGTPGDDYLPTEGTNIEALIEHGFIESDKPPTKSAKPLAEPSEE